VKNIFLFGLLVSALAVPQLASAQSTEGPVRRLEQKVRELEGRVYEMDQRLSRLEYPPTPPPPQLRSISCMVVDTGYSKTFLGQGRAQLEAEANAREKCGSSVSSSYCNGSVKCSSPTYDSRVRGFFCLVTDSGYGKTFKGEGENEVEAEGAAKTACQNSVNASYCGKVTARCEAILQ
jgi:hypothetical protein